ncbi:ATP-dependent DNA helicase PIF1 [Biomphalaria pfeifferi]|uniref:ATP-dependent DNA helicase PIF1 n=1 Tax=Biomphalaria pfeifferi TaxID=112525 RepID=A0AAD8B999_BIOPF|nr:ATP-dependent DNA helicase PIF1 [Biomphalaria pfeifferi]
MKELNDSMKLKVRKVKPNGEPTNSTAGILLDEAPSVFFINTSRPDNCVYLAKSEEYLRTFDPDSIDVFAKGILKHYQNRPDCLQDICLSDFAAWYDVLYPRKKKDARDFRDKEEVNSTNSGSEENSQEKEVLTLKGQRLCLKKRTKPKVIRWHKPNSCEDEEEHFRVLLMLFFPWRNEEKELLSASCKTKYIMNSKIIDNNLQKYSAKGIDLERLHDLIKMRKSLTFRMNVKQSNMNVLLAIKSKTEKI